MEKMVKEIIFKVDFLKKIFFIDAKQGKAKRVRTTFTEEQLQILQANFEVDSNPDGQDLERIAQITGIKTFFQRKSSSSKELGISSMIVIKSYKSE
jgi:hypothetical protein